MITRGTHTVSAYLHARHTAELIEFYRQAFGAEVGYRGERPDGSVEHAELTIGDSLLEISDTPSPNPVMMHHYVTDADKIYARALAAGAESLRAPVDQPYGDREAGIRDLAGNLWYIATHRGAAGPIPEGLRSLNLYLNPNGATQLIEFIKRAFGGEELHTIRAADGTVAHALVRIGDSVVEVSDANATHPPMPCVIRVFLPEIDDTYEQALRAGATSLGAPEDKPYGERGAGVKDAFGNTWYLAKVLD